MAETPVNNIDHNIRVVHLLTGEHIICNFGQVMEEEKFGLLMRPTHQIYGTILCGIKFSIHTILLHLLMLVLRSFVQI